MSDPETTQEIPTPPPAADGSLSQAMPKTQQTDPETPPAFADPEGPAIEKAAEEARERAYAGPQAGTWSGLPLQPYSFAREQMYRAARAWLPELPPGIDLQTCDVRLFAVHAAIILFLCTTGEAELDTLRTSGLRILKAAESFADCHAISAEDIVFALETHNAADRTRAACISSGPRPAESGNAPGP